MPQCDVPPRWSAPNCAPEIQARATGFQNAVANLPAELANLPSTIRGLAVNPVSVAQQFINQQIGYAS